VLTAECFFFWLGAEISSLNAYLKPIPYRGATLSVPAFFSRTVPLPLLLGKSGFSPHSKMLDVNWRLEKC